MGTMGIREAIEPAGVSWGVTYQVVESVLKTPNEDMGKDFVREGSEFLRRRSRLLTTLCESISRRYSGGTADDRRSIFDIEPTETEMQDREAILEFFHEYARLVSNFVYFINHEDGLDLEVLDTLPSRHSILDKIVSQSGDCSVLLARIQAIVAAHEGNICAICRSSIVFPADAVNAVSGLSHWLAVSNDGDELMVGHEGEQIPIKMECGHVFCAGCIARYLKEGRRLQCPFRDDDYGIDRGHAVREIERIGKRADLNVDGLRP